MSTLRSELYSGTTTPIADDVFFQKLHASLKTRRGLIKGQIDKGKKSHCAMGCFWDDVPDAAVKNTLIDEVAAVNDSVPDSLGTRVRMQIVRNWVKNRALALKIDLE